MKSGDFVSASDVGFEVARSRWAEVAREVLIEVAREGHGTTTYAHLANQIQERTRIRTNQLIHNWIGDVLGRVARECAQRQEPLLSALCLDKSGSVGGGYAAIVAEIEGVTPENANAHAARERAACYSRFGADVDDHEALQRLFAADMKGIYRRAKLEAGYNATLFLRMLADSGPFETARHLVLSQHASEGFTALWERKRLDLTVEALVLRPQYRSLFPEGLLEAAERRLREYGYEPTHVNEDVHADHQAGESESFGATAVEPHPADKPPEPATGHEQPQPRSAPPPRDATPPSVPPGWFDDPYHEAFYRWWDGWQWTGWTDRNWRPGEFPLRGRASPHCANSRRTDHLGQLVPAAASRPRRFRATMRVPVEITGRRPTYC